MTIYLIKVDNLYYGKINNIYGRIINPSQFIDENVLYLTVKEIAYKTKSAAIKAAKQLQKEKENSKISIQGLILKEV